MFVLMNIYAQFGFLLLKQHLPAVKFFSYIYLPVFIFSTGISITQVNQSQEILNINRYVEIYFKLRTRLFALHSKEKIYTKSLKHNLNPFCYDNLSTKMFQFCNTAPERVMFKKINTCLGSDLNFKCTSLKNTFYL